MDRQYQRRVLFFQFTFGANAPYKLNILSRSQKSLELIMMIFLISRNKKPLDLSVIDEMHSSSQIMEVI